MRSSREGCSRSPGVDAGRGESNIIDRLAYLDLCRHRLEKQMHLEPEQRKYKSIIILKWRRAKVSDVTVSRGLALKKVSRSNNLW